MSAAWCPISIGLGRGLRIKAEALPLDGKGLSIQGTLPWRLTLVPEDTAANVGFARAPADTMALTVRADSFDLAFFEPFLPEETAQELSGNLAVDARIGGTPDQPRATGTMDLRGFGVSLPTLGVTYSEGTPRRPARGRDVPHRHPADSTPATRRS